MRRDSDAGIVQSEKLIVACVSVWYTKEVVTLLIRYMQSPFRFTRVDIECHWLRRLAVVVAGWAWCLAFAACGTFSSPDVKRGDQHLAAGNWEEASVAFRQALKDDPFEPSLQNKYRISRERAAAAHDERGRQLLKDRQFDQAAEEFKRALTIEPTSKEYEAGLTEALRFKESRDRYREAERLAQLGRVTEAMTGYMRAVELDPTYKDALEGVARLSAEQHAVDRDDRQKQPVTLQFRNAGLKEVVEALGKAAHVNFVFDKDVRNDPITVSLEEKPFDEALSLVLNSNSLFAQKAGPTLFIISPNTKQKQEQYQDLMIRTFYLSSAKAKDMVALLKSMLDVKHIHGNEALNTIVVRDQPEKVELAEKIIQANDREDSEVLFDVEVLEVNRTVDQQYGLNYPKQIGASLVPPGFTGTIAGDLAQQFTYRNLASLGQDSYLFKVPTNVQLDFFKQITDAKTLAAPKVRVLNNKKAEVNIGDKQPILLSTTNVLPGQAATGAVPTTSTVTSIEFRDTGVKLTVEPNIHLANELSLKMKIEVIRLGDTVLLQQSPPITQFKFGNRSAETMLNVRDGETIILGGLLQEEDRRTKVTIPWIGDIPYLGNLLSSFKTQRVTTEVILTITPHIVNSLRIPGPQGQAFWSGTESVYSTSPLFAMQPKPVSARVAVPTVPGTAIEKNGSKKSKMSTMNPDVASPSLHLAIQPADATVQMEKEIRVDVLATQAHGFDTETFTLEFDPKILEFRDATLGEVLGTEAGKAPVAATSSLTDGIVELRLHRSATATKDEGRLLRLTFLAKSPGVSPVRLQMAKHPGQDVPEGIGEASGVVRVR
ncbi:MAG: Putative General secretion pathway protein D [Nitrospira sp.]|nr:MAG: Putative General secretion pathway protein D [Nitrospira sp.]